MRHYFDAIAVGGLVKIVFGLYVVFFGSEDVGNSPKSHKKLGTCYFSHVLSRDLVAFTVLHCLVGSRRHASRDVSTMHAALCESLRLDFAAGC